MSISTLERQFELCDCETKNEFEFRSYDENANFISSGVLPDRKLSFGEAESYMSFLNTVSTQLEEAKNMSFDLASSLEEMLAKVPNLDSLELGAHSLAQDNIKRITPQYLTQFVSNFSKVIKALKVKSINDLDTSRYSPANQTLDLLEKQCVSCDYAPNSSVKVPTDDLSFITLSKKEVENTYVKYANSIDSVYKSIKNDISNSLNEFKNCYLMMKQCNDIVHEVESNLTNDVDIAHIQYLVYNGTKMIIETMSWICRAVARRVGILTSNIKAINDLRVQLSTVATTENTISYMESVSAFEFDDLNISTLVDDATEGDYSLLATALDNILEHHSDNLMEVIAGVDIDDFVEPQSYLNGFVSNYRHEVSPIFNIVESIILRTEDRFNEMVSISNNDLFSVEDFIKENPIDMWGGYGHDIASLDPDTLTIGFKKRYAFLISEIMYFESDVDGVAMASKDFANNLLTTYRETALKLQEEDSSIDDSTAPERANLKYSNIANLKALLTYIKKYVEVYEAFISDWTNSLVKRFKSINNELYQMESNKRSRNVSKDSIYRINAITKSEDFNYDYTEMAHASIMDTVLFKYDAMFEERALQHNKEMVLKESGYNIIYEADEDASAQKPSETKPTVTDNSKDASSGSSSSSSSGSIGEAFSNIIGSIGKFFGEIFNKFSNVVDRQAETNKDWLEEHDEELETREYNDVSIDIINYGNMPAEQIHARMKMTMNRVKSIATANGPRPKSRAETYKLLFPYVKNVEWTDDMDLAEVLTKYFKVGDAKFSKVTVANEELKNYVANIKSWCKQYYDTYKNNTTTVGKQLTDAAETAAKYLRGDQGSGTDLTTGKTNAQVDAEKKAAANNAKPA